MDALLRAIMGDMDEGDGGMRVEDGHNGRNRPMPEAAIHTLTEIAKRYGKSHGHKVGDIVHPIKGSPIKGRGMPHLVVEVLDTPLDLRNLVSFTLRDVMSNAFCQNSMNIRVMLLHDGDNRIGCYYGEGWQYEPFDPVTDGE